MNPRIVELYESAGVDVNGLEHRVRQRWNNLTPDLRAEQLRRISETQYRFLRWDQLPRHVQQAMLAVIKRSKPQ